MMRELHSYIAQPLRVQRFQSLTDAPVQLGPAAPRLALIENLPVQGMHEFITRGDAGVWKRLRGSDTHNAMPARQPVAEVLELFQGQVSSPGTNVDCKCRPDDARRLHRSLPLSAKTLDMTVADFAQNLRND